jgi:hypothetical protein
MSAGGGGSGYAAGTITSPTLTTASAQTVANSGSAYWASSAGQGAGVSGTGNTGRVVIRYPFA